MTLSSSPGTDDMSVLCVGRELSSVSFVCGGGEKGRKGRRICVWENPPDERAADRRDGRRYEWRVSRRGGPLRSTTTTTMTLTSAVSPNGRADPKLPAKALPSTVASSATSSRRTVPPRKQQQQQLPHQLHLWQRRHQSADLSASIATRTSRVCPSSSAFNTRYAAVSPRKIGLRLPRPSLNSCWT